MNVEELELEPGEERYDVAFAVRVGAFDGRDRRAGALALARLGRRSGSRRPAVHRWW